MEIVPVSLRSWQLLLEQGTYVASWKSEVFGLVQFRGSLCRIVCCLVMSCVYASTCTHCRRRSKFSFPNLLCVSYTAIDLWLWLKTAFSTASLSTPKMTLMSGSLIVSNKSLMISSDLMYGLDFKDRWLVFQPF